MIIPLIQTGSFLAAAWRFAPLLSKESYERGPRPSDAMVLTAVFVVAAFFAWLAYDKRKH